ncbi:Activator of (R)-2-hydroxyglutaryl-CoA dehydratase, partial [hydrothermal vent metagenome]
KKNLFKYLSEYGITQKQIDEAVDFAITIEKKAKSILTDNAQEIINKAKGENKPLIIVLGRPYHLDPMINNGILDMIYDLGAYAITEDSIPDLHKENLEGVLPLTQWSYHNRLYLAAKWIVKQKYDKIATIQLNSFGCGPDAVVVDEVKSIIEAGGKIYISIKIDEMSNLGAAKIRIRSLLEAMDQNKNIELKPRLFTKKYSKEDKKKNIIVPYFAKTYSELMEPVLYRLGYNLVTLHKQSKENVDLGLRYVNNDMCYPAVIVIGDLLKALRSGKYDPDNSVVALTQTNGQCRASNYVPLLKKALVDAGFVNTPVITLSADSFAEGFVFNPIKLIKYTIILYAIADALLRLKTRTKPYEVHHGDTQCLYDRLQNELVQRAYEEPPSKKMLIEFIRYAVREFNKIEVDHKEDKRKVGISGEIYLKSNDFSNNNLIDWLENKGFEVKLPSYLKFFEYGYYSQIYDAKERINILPLKLSTRAINHFTIDHYRKIIEKELMRFKFYEPETLIEEAIKDNDNVMPQYLQFGEGWLLPMEIAAMAKEGVKDVISVQPFGCISNHIVAKGEYRELKDKFGVNMLLLDYEAGTSQVNIENRLELFLSSN